MRPAEQLQAIWPSFSPARQQFPTALTAAVHSLLVHSRQPHQFLRTAGGDSHYQALPGLLVPRLVLGQLSLLACYRLTLESAEGTMAQAWKKVELGGQVFLFQLIVREGIVGYSCYLTDLVNIYKEQIDKHGFSDKFSSINSDLELDDISEGFEEVTGIMNSEGGSSRKMKGEVTQDCCDLQVEWFSEGIPYKWVFNMVKGSSSEFHDLVTKSLLKCMALLLGEREELVSIIRSKDLEIEDYENSGAKLTRKGLKTTWFKPELAFNETKPVEIEDEINFMTSSEIQSVISKTVVWTETDQVDSKVENNGSVFESPAAAKEVKDITPKLNTKRKIVKPDLTKIADKMNNKKRKLNSL